jgi:hypothetical protein
MTLATVGFACDLLYKEPERLARRLSLASLLYAQDVDSVEKPFSIDWREFGLGPPPTLVVGTHGDHTCPKEDQPLTDCRPSPKAFGARQLG